MIFKMQGRGGFRNSKSWVVLGVTAVALLLSKGIGDALNSHKIKDLIRHKGSYRSSVVLKTGLHYNDLNPKLQYFRGATPDA